MVYNQLSSHCIITASTAIVISNTSVTLSFCCEMSSEHLFAMFAPVLLLKSKESKRMAQLIEKRVKRCGGKRQHSCRKCSFKASRKSVMLLHQIIHTGDKPFQFKPSNKSQSGGKPFPLLQYSGGKPFQPLQYSGGKPFQPLQYSGGKPFQPLQYSGGKPYAVTELWDFTTIDQWV